jgi:hypothetical protein
MSKSKQRPNKTIRVVTDQKLIAGLQKHLGGASLVLGGKTYTALELVAFLQKRVDTKDAADAAHAVWLSRLEAERAAIAETKPIVSALRQYVLVTFGPNHDTLADFGIAPRKQAVTTPAEKVQQIALAQATRAARHTAGPKQKAKIKGSVVHTPPSPIAPPATSPVAPTVAKPDTSSGGQHS